MPVVPAAELPRELLISTFEHELLTRVSLKLFSLLRCIQSILLNSTSMVCGVSHQTSSNNVMNSHLLASSGWKFSMALWRSPHARYWGQVCLGINGSQQESCRADGDGVWSTLPCPAISSTLRQDNSGYVLWVWQSWVVNPNYLRSSQHCAVVRGPTNASQCTLVYNFSAC